MKQPRSNVLALLLALTFAAGFSGCSERSVSQSSKAADSSAAAQNVNVASVESQKLHTTLTLPAQLMPYESVAVFPKVTGFIEKINVDRGSKVRTGQLIVRLSAPELVAQRAQAEAALQTAQSQLAAAKAKLASDQGTYEHLAAAAKTPGVVAGNDLLVAEQKTAADRAQVDATQHSVLAAQEAVRSVTQLESYLEIRAPFDGVVTERNLHPGALVGPSSGASGAQPIVRIESLGRLRLVVPVPEAYTADIRDREQVPFTVAAFPGQTFRAPVARVSNDVAQATRTMAVELDVHDARLTPGTFASVQWPIQRDYPTLFVPTAAVTNNLQRIFVIRVNGGKAEWIDVKTGLAMNGKTEVFGDVKQGDQVVVPASDALTPGTSVNIQQNGSR